MSTLSFKLQALAQILHSRNFREIDSLEDLSIADCDELFNESNIKFAETHNGILCFCASSPGHSGLSTTKIKSLLYFVDAYGGIRIDPITQEVHLVLGPSPKKD